MAASRKKSRLFCWGATGVPDSLGAPVVAAAPVSERVPATTPSAGAGGLVLPVALAAAAPGRRSAGNFANSASSPGPDDFSVWRYGTQPCTSSHTRPATLTSTPSAVAPLEIGRA